MSKHVKIREIFGLHSPYHPNQLVAKQHLPPEGLCRKELMYRVACKISDLKVLNDQGILAMDAWDFIRWRIGRKLEEQLGLPGQSGQRFVSTLIYKLCDESKCGSTGYEDSVMRQAVLISAQYQNRIASFKTNTAQAGYSAARSLGSGLPRRRTNEANRKRNRRTGGSQSGQTASAQRAEERRQRRAQLAAQSGSYQGVNEFRNKQRDRQVLQQGDSL
ncbi:subunit IV of cytochrome c oxidase, partial [Metarhizium majus ARSEF 297]